MARLINLKSKEGTNYLINPDHIRYVYESKDHPGFIKIHLTGEKSILVEKNLDQIRLDINNALNPPL